MWIVMYTWDYETESQRWQEQRFESAYEVEQFVMSLMDDGIAIVRTFKEPFNR
jgi:hypothetical protein